MNGYMRFFDNFFGFFKNIGISFGCIINSVGE